MYYIIQYKSYILTSIKASKQHPSAALTAEVHLPLLPKMLLGGTMEIDLCFWFLKSCLE